MPRTQTLDAQAHAKREGDEDLRGSTRCLRSRGRRERDLLICIRLQEDYN